MKIDRIDRTAGFTTIPNAAVRDASLSFRARGILAWMLSHQDGWVMTSKTMAASGTEGREAIRAALRELEAARYLLRHREQTEKGHWVTRTILSDAPMADEPGTGFRASVDRTSVDRALEEDHEEDHQEGSSLRSEEVQSQESAVTQEKPTAVAVKAAQEYVDWHRSERQSDPVSPFQALRSVATALAKKGYTSDEIVDGFKETRVMSAKAVQDVIDRARAAAEGRTVGPTIPQSVVRAFVAADPWLRDHGFPQSRRTEAMKVVASFVGGEYGVGETMLRMAVALRELPVLFYPETLRFRMYRAQVDRFPGELADYPDAMERAFRNRYWRAA